MEIKCLGSTCGVMGVDRVRNEIIKGDVGLN